jgi:hypothetical protein
LHVQIVYEAENRKPSSILAVFFNRLYLDDVGKFIKNESHPALQNFLNYGLSTVESLRNCEKPLPIPAAPILPNHEENEYGTFQFGLVSGDLYGKRVDFNDMKGKFSKR